MPQGPQTFLGHGPDNLAGFCVEAMKAFAKECHHTFAVGSTRAGCPIVHRVSLVSPVQTDVCHLISPVFRLIASTRRLAPLSVADVRYTVSSQKTGTIGQLPGALFSR